MSSSLRPCDASRDGEHLFPDGRLCSRCGFTVAELRIDLCDASASLEWGGDRGDRRIAMPLACELPAGHAEEHLAVARWRWQW